MALFGEWERYPIVGWTYDDKESLINAISDFSGRDGQVIYDDNINRYKRDYYDNAFKKVLFDFGLKFQLGGSQDKARIITTDRPQGIFDFSLASKGLYRVPEYYSANLAKEKPDRFIEFGTLSGVVPPNFVRNRMILGIRQFYFLDEDGKEYVCNQYQKGLIEMKEGVKGAKLKFATTTKKVFLKFKRQGGKVNYIEIYSLFYYTSVSGDDGYALRHLPAIMVCEYFESLGIKCRFYATRFVVFGNSGSQLRENDLLTGAKLPMYSIRNLKSTSSYLCVQPILAKEYGEEFDPAIALAISGQNSSGIYDNIIQDAQRHDVISDDYPTGGNPDWSEIDYRIGFERYKNKYIEYVEAGIFKGKEVKPEAQILFHSMSIKRHQSNIRNIANNAYSEYYLEPCIAKSQFYGRFIEWWMKFCSMKLRDYILLLNTKEPRKEMEMIAKEMRDYMTDYFYYFSQPQNAEDTNFKDSVSRYINDITKDEYLSLNFVYDSRNHTATINPDIKGYISDLINDVAIYAEKQAFPTPIEQQEKMDELAENLYNELERINI